MVTMVAICKASGSHALVVDDGVFTASAHEVAEGELQSVLHCMGAPQGPQSLHRVSPQVSGKNLLGICTIGEGNL